MTQTSEDLLGTWTAADLVERFGPIPLHRIRLVPPPGTATEEDVVRLNEQENRIFELVDGILVEKTEGTYESYLAGVLIQWIGRFVAEHKLGIVLAPDGMMRLAPGLVRIPDVSFIGWDRLPGRRVPRETIAELAPDLAIEVISRWNTPREMQRKLADYFAAGVGQVWYVYHSPRREVWVYTSPEEYTVVQEPGAVDGGAILRGFSLNLGDLFAEPTE